MMLKKQNEVNEKAMGATWTNLKLDWNTAILVETGELIDSLDWKWWKRQESNWHNAQVEAIDILHFALSIFIESNPTKDEITKLESDIQENFQLYASEKDIVCNCKELTVATLTNTAPSEIIIKAIKLCASLGLTLEQTANLYIGKNILNKFRQDNGYKDGTYIKQWTKDEDNNYMHMFSINHKYNENFEKNLWEHLSKTYASVVAS